MRQRIPSAIVCYASSKRDQGGLEVGSSHLMLKLAEDLLSDRTAELLR